jgi:SAM-dependent methyltransferase
MSQTDWEPMDFDAVYRRVAPGPTVPWDIGGPQPALVELERAGRVRGRVLDAGCGVGGNAIFLAGLGYRVTGIDSAVGAIGRAQQDAADRGVDVEFAVADAVGLDGYEGRFDTVVDSALYHCLDEDEQHRYVRAAHRATAPGAMLDILCLSDRSPLPGVTEAGLRETLRPWWSIVDLRRTEYRAIVSADLVAKFPAAAHLFTDAAGLNLLPAWLVTADRADG